MKDLTEDEYDVLDQYFTNNTIMPDTSKPGFFARKYGMTVKLDPETTQFLAAQSEITHKTFTEIIREMVQEKIAVAM